MESPPLKNLYFRFFAWKGKNEQIGNLLIIAYWVWKYFAWMRKNEKRIICIYHGSKKRSAKTKFLFTYYLPWGEKTKKPASLQALILLTGRGDPTRTDDHLHPMQVR